MNMTPYIDTDLVNEDYCEQPLTTYSEKPMH